MTDLAGKVVAITGAGRGLGAATARLLAAEGMRVAVGDLAGADQIAAEISGFGCELDVTDPASMENFLTQTEAELGPISVLINNAGIMPLAHFVTQDATEIEKILAINLTAVIRSTQSYCRLVQARNGEGQVINISSAAGRFPMAGGAVYAASKYGVSGFSNSADLEFASQGIPIRVTAFHPGIIRTQLAAGVEDVAAVRSSQPEEIAAAILATIKHPSRDVFAPKAIGFGRYTDLLLPKKVGAWLNRVSGGERLALNALDNPEREVYNEALAKLLGKGRK